MIKQQYEFVFEREADKRDFEDVLCGTYDVGFKRLENNKINLLEDWIKYTDVDGRGILFQFTDADIEELKEIFNGTIKTDKRNKENKKWKNQ